ncbi:DNA repair protein recA homolog 2, mitochondrial-like [Macadamia integrifolia]|uniref:DNA repair protein recA homolog 2, mitochondrial-like n=1 Tax=Macadamia integrifolia TaxID=60698 RepID=UPI001C4F58BA|nr:DNA repair protein recA homolog 2, mitochondrial-like [Macadamia integrifolia]
MLSFVYCAFSRLPRLNGFGRISSIQLLLPSLRQNGRRDAVDSVEMHAHCISSVADVPDYECDKLHDDVKAVEKDAALRLALSRLAGDFGRESMLSLESFFRSRYAPVIPTGSLKLDLALGIGGLPKVIY